MADDPQAGRRSIGSRTPPLTSKRPSRSIQPDRPGSLALFALVSGSALPVLLGAGLELIYLSLIPQSSRFRRLVLPAVRAEEAPKEAASNAIFQELPPECG